MHLVWLLNLEIPGSKRNPCLQFCLESKLAPKLQYPPLALKLGNPHRLPLSCRMQWESRNCAAREKAGERGKQKGAGNLFPLNNEGWRGWGSSGRIFAAPTPPPLKENSKQCMDIPALSETTSTTPRDNHKRSNIPSAMLESQLTPTVFCCSVFPSLKRGFPPLSSSPAVVSSVGQLQMTISHPTNPPLSRSRPRDSQLWSPRIDCILCDGRAQMRGVTTTYKKNKNNFLIMFL